MTIENNKIKIKQNSLIKNKMLNKIIIKYIIKIIK